VTNASSATASPIDYVLGEQIPEPTLMRGVAPGGHGLRMLVLRMGECIAHLNHLMHTGRLRRKSHPDGVLRCVAA